MKEGALQDLSYMRRFHLLVYTHPTSLLVDGSDLPTNQLWVMIYFSFNMRMQIQISDILRFKNE